MNCDDEKFLGFGCRGEKKKKKKDESSDDANLINLEVDEGQTKVYMDSTVEEPTASVSTTTNSTTTNSNTTCVDQGEEDINSIPKFFNAKISNMKGIGDKAVNVGKGSNSDPSTTSDPMSTTTTSPKKATTSVPMVTSFASMFKDTTPEKVVKISEMGNTNCVAGANVTIPIGSRGQGK